MCGRYSLATGIEAIRALFRIEGEAHALAPRVNSPANDGPDLTGPA